MGNDGLLSMAFVEDNFAAGDAREGHATLAWNEVDGAAQYELTAQDATRMYRGVMAQAFVSGLTNGTYEFRAVALNEAGEVIAATRVPATVIVQHWRLRDALALFLCGLIVFVSLIVVMIRGTMASGSGPAAEVRPSRGRHLEFGLPGDCRRYDSQSRHRIRAARAVRRSLGGVGCLVGATSHLLRRFRSGGSQRGAGIGNGDRGRHLDHIQHDHACPAVRPATWCLGSVGLFHGELRICLRLRR